ncbi:beta-lactamase family protein [Streptomyces sp. ISL-90]|nr:beta-lactamase family protein [Streptomyces sp. ISL-90]
MTRFDHAFDWARRHVEHGPYPTAVLGIATADGVVALDAFGTERGRAASVDDHYPLFSITKPIVGLAALHLIEQGRLTPETPLDRAISGFGADRDDVVQLRHLVSHTSGIIEPPMDAPGLRELLLAPGRDFAAGTASRYSTIAFEGIAALIEHAGGVAFERAISATARARGCRGAHVRRRGDPARGHRRRRPGRRLRAIRGAAASGRRTPRTRRRPARDRHRAAAERRIPRGTRHVRRDAHSAHRRHPEARAIRRLARAGLGLHVEPPPLGTGPARPGHVRARRLGRHRVLDHAVGRSLLRAAHEHRGAGPPRDRHRRAAQRGRRGGSLSQPRSPHADAGEALSVSVR